MRRIVTEEEIKAAIFTPPETTRAYFRGRVRREFQRRDRIDSMGRNGFS